MYCEKGSLVNLGKYAIRAVTLKCRSWSCENCSQDRARQLVELAQSGKPTTFITLTVNPAVGSSPAGRARALVVAWRELVVLICEEWNVDHVPYLCVFEATKRGEPHLHILCRLKYIPQRWLSDQMRDLLDAPIVDIRAVKNARHVAFYMAKYIGKDPHRFGTCKRYWRTRSYRLAEVERVPEDPVWSDLWHVSKYHLAALAAVWKHRGYDVQYEGDMLVAMREVPP